MTDIKDMPEWQQRVVVEKSQLDDKIAKLYSFLNSAALVKGVPHEDYALLRSQLNIMRAYSSVLELRINRFHHNP